MARAKHAEEERKMKFVKWITQPIIRQWLYGLAVAINAGVATWGFIDGQQSAALNAIFAALFFMAGINTDTQKDDDYDAT